MGKLERIVADVPDDMAAGIRSAVGTGAYASTSEVIYDALKHWLGGERPAGLSMNALRGMIDESAVGDAADIDVFFDDLDSRCAALIADADRGE